MSTTETNHSQGDFVFPNGDEYSGGYISGENGIQMSGYGTWTSKQGYVYEGNWQNDRMEGQGRLSMPDGSVFEGQFQNGKFHGHGVYCWSDGSKYEGPFEENRPDGEGKYYDVENRQNWIGKFHPKGALQLKHIIASPL